MSSPIALRQRRFVSLSTLFLATALLMPAPAGAQSDAESAADANDKIARQIRGNSKQKRAAGPKARCQSFDNRVTYKRGGTPGKGSVKRDFGAGNEDKGELVFNDAATGTGLFWTQDPGYISVYIAALVGDLGAEELLGLLFEAAPGTMPRRALLDRLADLAASDGVTQEELFEVLNAVAKSLDGGCLWSTRFVPRKDDRGQVVSFWAAMMGVPIPEAPPVSDGRFRAEVSWQDFDGADRSTAQSFEATLIGDSAPWYFFDIGDEELLVRLVDTCSTNDHFWVFAAAATDVAYELTVTDTASDQTKTYSRSIASSPAIVDTAAFSTCP